MTHSIPIQQMRVPASEASVDMIRLIRRSIRCFWFGLIGVIPLIGVGLAWHALRLCEKSRRDAGQTWQRPVLWWLWATGLGFMLAYERLFGGVGVLAVFVIFLGLQSCLIWRRDLRDERGACVQTDREQSREAPKLACASSPIWNPAAKLLRWGIVLAYAGYFGSWSSLGMIALAFAGIAFQDV